MPMLMQRALRIFPAPTLPQFASTNHSFVGQGSTFTTKTIENAMQTLYDYGDAATQHNTTQRNETKKMNDVNMLGVPLLRHASGLARSALRCYGARHHRGPGGLQWRFLIQFQFQPPAPCCLRASCLIACHVCEEWFSFLEIQRSAAESTGTARDRRALLAATLCTPRDR